MPITREERRRTGGARAPGGPATAPVRLTWPMLVGAVIAAAIIALGAAALGNGGSVDIGFMNIELFPRAE